MLRFDEQYNIHCHNHYHKITGMMTEVCYPGIG
jgi:hypothetical protein